MKNITLKALKFKSIGIVQVFAVLFTLLMLGNNESTYAQAEARQGTVEVKAAFFGSWKDTQDPNHFVEIFKDGGFVIVYRHSNKKDGSDNKRYAVSSAKGNKIMVDYNFGVTPLTISEDGSKITFTGQTYTKQ